MRSNHNGKTAQVHALEFEHQKDLAPVFRDAAHD
jgi:hypothetical protein